MKLITILAVSSVLVAPNAASALVVSFPDFGNTVGLQLNGDTAASGNVLRLVPDQTSQVGSAFFGLALPTTTNFDSKFAFQVTGSLDTSLRSDGFAFVVQNDGRGANALGRGGQDIGYGDITANPGIRIQNSVEVEFDTYQNVGEQDDHHIRITDNGDAQAFLAHVKTPQLLDNGTIYSVDISYVAVTHFLKVDLSDPLDPTDHVSLATILDISAQTGPNAFFGFTGATGGGQANYDILNWTLDVPEPATLALFGAGVVGVGAFRRRQRRNSA